MALPAVAAPPLDLGIIPSVALVDDAAALPINPAGIGSMPGGSAFLSRQGWGTGQTRLLLGAGSLGLGYMNDSTGAVPLNDYSFGLGFGLIDPVRMGITYHIPAEGRPWAYDLGLMARPFNFLSLGLATRNALGSPSSTGREYQFGAGFRPFGPNVTLSADLPYYDGVPFSWGNLRPFFGITGQVMDGVQLMAMGDTAGSFRVGLALNTPSLRLGGMSDGNQYAINLRTSSLRSSSALGFKGTSWATLDLSEAIAATRTSSLLGPATPIPADYAVLKSVEHAAKDPQVAALIVKVGPTGVGWGLLEEIRASLVSFKKSGKPLWVYLEDTGFEEYYVASAADRIFLNPMGTIQLNGISHQMTYFKGLMDLLGVQPHFIAMGRYKTAMEPFERSEPSPAQREQNQALIDDQYNRVVAAIAASRRLPVDKVNGLVRQALFEAPAAQSAGLVDELASRDEVSKRLEQATGHGLSGMNALSLNYQQVAWAPPRVAVITLQGAIAEGHGGNDFLEGPSQGAETLVEAIRATKEDSSIKAVVFRVDSPGGSAMASEIMRRELALLAERKPVVVSFGDVAASGGYWVAQVPKTILYADPGTITGSIGVIVGKFSIDGLLAKWGITHATLKDGEHADMDSQLRAYTPEEEARLRQSGEFYYGKFVNLVAAHRGLSEGRVRELGSGHVYTGAMALGFGLVDRIGGLSEAIAEAKARGGVASQEVETAFYPAVNPFGALIDDSDGQLRLDMHLSVEKEITRSVERLKPWTEDRVWLLPEPLGSDR